MITDPDSFTCEVIISTLCDEDEEQFLTYGIRAVAKNRKTIYEFEDISPDKTRVEQFAAFLNQGTTPVTHLHFAVMDFLQAM